MLDTDRLREEMQKKIANIPVPDAKLLRRAKDKNKKLAEKIHKDKIRILNERKKEALRDNDTRKKFAAIALEQYERDRFALMKRIGEIESELKNIEKTFGEERELFEFFTEIKGDEFWKFANKHNAFQSNIEKDLYYKALGFTPLQIKKIKQYIKLKKELKQLQELDSTG